MSDLPDDPAEILRWIDGEIPPREHGREGLAPSYSELRAAVVRYSQALRRASSAPVQLTARLARVTAERDRLRAAIDTHNALMDAVRGGVHRIEVPR